jgi:hypothetical protein
MRPVESLSNTLALIDWEKEHFEKEIPHTAEIGMLKLDSRQIKTKITPSPDALKREL